MLMLKALQDRAISRLWLGQALSSIGDEIYRVGLVWMTVQMIGKNAGYLTAAQAASLMTLSFIGGKWADHWDPLPTMVRTDFIRGALVLIPVVVHLFTPVPLWLLIVVALALSALGAFFDPALQSSLPRFSKDLQTLRAATGLMSTTNRLARMVGPGLIGFLGAIVAPIHFFTLDAISFMISALSVQSLCEKRAHPNASSTEKIMRKRTTFAEAIVSGFRSLRKQEGMSFAMFVRAATSGSWNFVYGLGLALLVQTVAPNDTRAFGFVIASYGMGNFAGALFFGNRQRRKPGLLMFSGYVWMGIGFTLIALAPTMGWIMVAAAVSGFSGPMNDIAFVDVIQARFPLSEMTRIFRLRMATETASTLLFMGVSPLLLGFISVRVMIILSGVIWIVSGLVGLTYFQKSVGATQNPT